MTRTRTLAISALIAIAAGCSEEQQGAMTTAPQARHSNAPTSTHPFHTIDDEFDEMASAVPGFGGAYLGRDGATYVYHTNPNAGGLTAEIQKQLPQGLRRGTIRILKGDFDFHQLRTWKDNAADVLNEPGVLWVDADEMRNRVAFGVSSQAAGSRAIARAVEMGVPSNAIVVDVVSANGVHATIQDNGVGTIRQGLRIGIVDTASAISTQCTAGPLVYGWSNSLYHSTFYPFDTDFIDADLWQDRYYIITNSHCSGADSVHMGHTFPNVKMSQFVPPVVGIKYYDPAFFPSAPFSGCPSGQKCRYSDAAAYTLQGSYCPFNGCTVSGSYPGFATAYRTTTPWGDSTIYTASTTIDAVNGPWTIGGGYSVYAGDSLLKIAQNSGTVRGFVINTCVNVASTNFVGTPNGLTILCQMQGHMYDIDGDSGGAVYVRSGSNTILIAGLSWGGGHFASGVYFDTFSPWSYVTGDLSRLGHLFQAY